RLYEGDHVLGCRSLFGSAHQILSSILPKWGIDFSYGSIDDTENWESLIQDNSKVLFLETPSHPCLGLIDLQWAGKLAVAHNLILIVDNCFATSYLQQPMKFGADVVLHSDT